MPKIRKEKPGHARPAAHHAIKLGECAKRAWQAAFIAEDQS
jgi:hypothetical protein